MGRTQSWPSLQAAASMSPADALGALGSGTVGLTEAEAGQRLLLSGPNAVRSHHLRPWGLLISQLRSPLLLLLAATAAVSGMVGEAANALIIGAILTASIALGFINEYRAAHVAQALHAQMRHDVTVRRSGRLREVDVTLLVPGDVVDLEAGEVVPADLRLIDSEDLECDESVLTGESMPMVKGLSAVTTDTALADLSSCLLMGTVVRAGRGTGVVVGTGARTEFGRIAVALGDREPETQFQQGLRAFSRLLMLVAAVLTATIVVINVIVDRPVIDAVLFALAIAVGISPQLLPAVVATSLTAGARALARDRVLVKRLVCIEDLGDIEVLFTDKTGTLTQGHVEFMRAVGPDGRESDETVPWGLACSALLVEDGAPLRGNALDLALWESPAAARWRPTTDEWTVLARQPFDHDTRTMSVVVADSIGRRWLVTKGAPESVLPLCPEPAPAFSARRDEEFAAGNRVVAVARAPMAGGARAVTDAHGPWQLAGLLVFLDPPRPDAALAVQRLGTLGIDVKIVTGDNAAVAREVCAAVGLTAGAELTGVDIDALDDDALAARIPDTRIFARVSPAQKARVIRIHRRSGVSVAYLGDGVNDTLALHAADVGISVDTATDIAKDAADVILMGKDLEVLVAGVVGGRRIFANTMKYVLMGTSSNFGNMASAAAASAFLPFLPLLPSQVLLNNLLYDSSQLSISTDTVDDEQLRRPSHWDIGMIRRSMLLFGPVSSAFDFLTFGILLWGLHASVEEFRAGWFVESLATQALVIFAIRTRRVPFLRSRPSVPLAVSVITVVLIGAWLPASPLGAWLGFVRLPPEFLLVLVILVATYLLIIDSAKGWFFSRAARPAPPPMPPRHERLHRRASRFHTAGPLVSSMTGPVPHSTSGR